MAYIKFDPLRGFEQLAKRMSQVVDEIDKGVSVEFGSFSPRIDIAEDDKSLYLFAELPGMNKDNVKITINDDKVLILKGLKERDHKEPQEGEVNTDPRTYLRAERAYGEFNRSFELPDNINTDNINANFVNGVLQIKLAKIEPAKPKEVEINIA